MTTPTAAQTPSAMPSGALVSPAGCKNVPLAFRQSLPGAIVSVIPAVPFLAMLATVLIHAGPERSVVFQLAPWLKGSPLIGGAGFGLAMALIAIIFNYAVARRTSADRANPAEFNRIRQHLEELDVHLSSVRPAVDRTPHEGAGQRTADAFRCAAWSQLQGADAGWVGGAAYINIWGLIHRAEEALLLADTPDRVIAAAHVDAQRLGREETGRRGLDTGMVSALSRTLCEAVTVLRPQEASGHDRQGVVTGNPDLARAQLSLIRRILNRADEENRVAVVRFRVLLLSVFVGTALLSYLLLALGLIAQGQHPPQDQPGDPIVAAAMLYVVGAVVGLLSGLRGEAQRDPTGEDYGLVSARLALSSSLGGLAAVGWTVWFALLLTAVNPVMFPETGVLPAAAGSFSSMGYAPLRFEEILSPSANPFSIVVALVLSPITASTLIRNSFDRRVIELPS